MLGQAPQQPSSFTPVALEQRKQALLARLAEPTYHPMIVSGNSQQIPPANPNLQALTNVMRGSY